MLRDAFLYFVCGGIVVGLLLPQVLPIGAVAAALCALGAVGFLLFGRTRLLALCVAAALAATALGLLRAEQFLAAEVHYTLNAHVGTTTTFEGTVIRDPEERATAVYTYIQTRDGTLLALLPKTTRLQYGQRVVVRGVVEEAKNFETETGRMFDYKNYLRAQGVSVLMRRATLAEQTPAPRSLQGSLYALKHIFERGLETVFPKEQAALLQGILLGEKRALPESVSDAFLIAGLIHVVVLSGYNLSVVAEAVLRAFRSFLPRAAALALGGVSILLFVLLVGAGAATVRALVMGLIALLARYLRRPSVALRALAVAAAAMALWNPPALLYDIGFILSVVATFGLVTLAPTIENHIQWIPAWKRFNLRSIAASTAAVQGFILPALLSVSGVLSPFALVANMLALPLVPIVMLVGFVAGVIGVAAPSMALLPVIFTDALLRLIVKIAEVVAALPGAILVLPPFPVWVVLAVYMPLTLFAVWLYRRSVAPPQTSLDF